MNRETYIAASTGVLSFFENLTSSDSTLLQVTTEKNNVLHIAVQFNKDKVAKKIICLCRCLAEQTNSKGNIPLHVAARVGNPQMVRLLIDHVEDRDVEIGVQQLSRMVNLERDTALHIAVKYGNFEVVKELIKEDSKLAMYVNKAGESALFLAVDRQHYEIASHILCAAPKCSLAGRHGMNVLHALVIQTSNYINARMSKISFVERIRNKLANREQPPQHSFGIIQEDFVREVMRKYPLTIKEGDDSGWTPLHIAAQMDNKKCVNLLLENENSAAYVKNKEGLSALHIAAKEGNIDVMIELIRTSPDIYELLDNRGQTALHAAAESGKYGAVQFFLRRPEFEGLINEQDEEGNTPIHLAAIKRHNKVVSLLEEGKGLDFNAKNKEGFSIIDHIMLQMEFHFTLKIQEDFVSRLGKKGARRSLMGALLKFGIRKAGDGKGMAEITDYMKQRGQTYLLVATLIATVTFAAAFTVPGGYQSQGVDEGLAVLGKSAAFGAFLIANTLAFGLSMTSILIYFIAIFGGDEAYGLRLEFISSIYTYLAIIALLVAFISGTYTVVPHSLGITAAVILCLFFSITTNPLRVHEVIFCLIDSVVKVCKKKIIKKKM